MKARKFKRRSLIVIGFIVVFIIGSTLISRGHSEKTNITSDSKVEIPEKEEKEVIVEEEPASVEVEPDTFEPLEVDLDVDLQKYIFEVCKGYYVSPHMVIAMIERESRCNASTIGDGGNSYGLMQIQPRWHSARMERLGVTREELLDPYKNVLVGIDYLSELLESYGDVGFVLMCYNGGPSYAKKKAQSGMLSEYANTVLVRAYELENE